MAFYGEKRSAEFTALVAMCQQIAADVLRQGVHTVHDASKCTPRLWVWNALATAAPELRGQEVTMDPGAFVQYV